MLFGFRKFITGNFFHVVSYIYFNTVFKCKLVGVFVIYKGNNISGIITAKIEKVENHPNSKKLHILQVNTGKETVQVVCGAPNVREGMVTAFAQVGAKIGDITIGKATLAGVDSYGMCCSGKELDITDDNSGIMDLGDSTKLGVDLKKLLPIEDILIEVDNKLPCNK